ncbi:MAG: zinc ribbon domain-containing protein [Chloroflexi bacterium]|nr:zinc ribbon domain-containing protein [Chloroflexota bacterium]
MDQRTYHGKLTPDELASAVVAAFDQGNRRAQKVGSGERVMVQIATREWSGSGGQAALAVTIQRIEGGVTVSLGQHEWLGAAASILQTGVMALLNPITLLNRIDDVAQDVSSFSLPTQVWDVVEKYCRSVGAAMAMSERLQSVACPYCGVTNKVGDGKCSACGGPLGAAQPRLCPKCGNVMGPTSKFCDVCGSPLK